MPPFAMNDRTSKLGRSSAISSGSGATKLLGDVSVLIGEYPEIVELTLESRFDKGDPSLIRIRFKEDKKHYWLLKNCSFRRSCCSLMAIDNAEGNKLSGGVPISLRIV